MFIWLECTEDMLEAVIYTGHGQGLHVWNVSVIKVNLCFQKSSVAKHFVALSTNVVSP